MVRLACFFGLSLVLGLSPALACLHGPEGFAVGDIEESGQKALIFWRKGYQDLTLQVDYKVKVEASKLKSLAWVVPLPEVPVSFDTADPAVFQDAFRLTVREPGVLKRSGVLTFGGRGRAEERVGEVYVAAKVTVGAYDITALKTRGPDAAKALNAWLKERGFGEVAAENMKYYVEKKWTFLAIKIDTAKAAADQEKSGALRPLRVVFKSEDIVYPLKFSSHQGRFQASVSIFTDRPLPLPDWFSSRGFRVVTRGNGLSPGSEQVVLGNLEYNARYWEKRLRRWRQRDLEAARMLASIKARSPSARTALFKQVQSLKKGPLGRFPNLWITRVEGASINGESNRLADWKEDFIIDMKDYGKRLSEQELELLGGGRRPR